MKKLVSIAVSIAILILVYSMLDTHAVISALRRTNLPLLMWSLVLLVFLVLLSALRLSFLAALGRFRLSPRTSVEATFAANALNMFLPGKLGDILKAVLMTGDNRNRLPGAISIGVWEKLADLSLLFLMASLPVIFFSGNAILGAVLLPIGICGCLLLLFPQPVLWLSRYVGRLSKMARAWERILLRLRQKPWRLLLLFLFTAVIWLGHLVQIAMMAAALGVSGTIGFWSLFVSLLPLAIVAGLVPLSFAGIGTRDAALVVLLAPLVGAETAAALGVLFWLRYLVPGLLGSPFLPRFLRILGGEIRNSIS